MRGMLGLSRAEFCRRIATSPASLRNYEEGVASPNAASLVKICREFGVSIQWLLFGTNPMFSAESLPATPDHPEERTMAQGSVAHMAQESEAQARPEPADKRTTPGQGEPRILDELYKAMELVRDLSGRNALLAEKVNELQGKVHALELENVRLMASRALVSGDSGARRKKTGHVARMPLVGPGSCLQEPKHE